VWVVIQNVFVVYTQNYNVINSKDFVRHNIVIHIKLSNIYIYISLYNCYASIV